MHAIRNAIVLAAIAGGAHALAGDQATFELLPVGSAFDVTIDEFDRTLVLTSDGYGGPIYIWEDGFLTFLGNGAPWGISDDGTTVSGTGRNTADEEEAARWTLSGSETLGYLPNALTCPSRSAGYKISGDGSTVVGLSWDGCNARAFKWTELTGMVEMAYLANGNARASGISSDGTVAVGFTQGNFSRTPAAWNVTDGTQHAEYPFDPEVGGELWAATPEGRTIAGSWSLVGVTTGRNAMYWNADEGIKLLGWLDDDNTAQAYDISADGRAIVGSSGTVFTGHDAFIWTPEAGMEKLADRLVADGADLGGASILTFANAISKDGRTIVGAAVVLPDEPDEQPLGRAFVATLPDPVPNTCPADFNGDGSVGFSDLTQLLNKWGPCTCVEDLDLNNSVGFSDLTAVLNAWGPCP